MKKVEGSKKPYGTIYLQSHKILPRNWRKTVRNRGGIEYTCNKIIRGKSSPELTECGAGDAAHLAAPAGKVLAVVHVPGGAHPPENVGAEEIRLVRVHLGDRHVTPAPILHLVASKSETAKKRLR